MIEFQSFNKIPRLVKPCIITEKIDGTNAQVHVLDDGTVLAGSRSRYITPEHDNYGFARWVREHEAELRELGPGRHYGEWWGAGIQRRYGIATKRFSLFNVSRWGEERPACCHVVPELYRGDFDTQKISTMMELLKCVGSIAAPGFMNPEGIVIYHTAAGHVYKHTFEAK